MKKILIESISPGMRFTDAVYIEGNNLLIPAKIAVKQKDIDQLKKWGITAVMTDGVIIKDEQAQAPKAQPAFQGSPLKLGKTVEKSEKYLLYKDMIEKLDAVFLRVRKNDEIQSKAIDQIVQALLGSVRDSQNEMIGFILAAELSQQQLAKSSVNSALLSVVIGSYLKMPNHKLMQLATGALLHDVGMLRVPEQIVQKQGHLSEDEAQKIKTHPLYSYKIICKELLYPDDVGVVALQHHERWDGEGYPRGMSGAEIDLGARIVSVSDAFEAMVSEKPYRNSMIGYAAMKNLLADNSRRFDPEILRGFIKSMGIYPIGSVVVLSNSAVARVVDNHPDAPLRPKIRILVDEFGKNYGPGEGDIVDLVGERTLFIARAVDPKDYQGV